jgi:putative transposase
MRGDIRPSKRRSRFALQFEGGIILCVNTICLKVRLCPTKAQETTLDVSLDTCRILYNRLLEWRKTAYEETGKSPSRYEQQAAFPAWKAENEYLARVHSQVLQEVGTRVDRTYQNFFRRCKEGKEKAGFPRFKGRGHYDSFTFPQSGFELQEDAVKLSKIGSVKAIVHRTVEGKIKTCTIRRQNGKWFACFAVEVETVPLEPNGEAHERNARDERNARAVGIDVGLSSFATLSNGEQIENPRFYRKDEKALAKAQRRMSKFEKGTKERRKARKVVARIHERIRNRRHNFVHQEARKIVDRFETIAVEKLNVKGMQGNHCLAKSIGDASWTMFRTVLAHKAASAGRQYAEVSPHFTSQDCSGCGLRAKKKLSERWHFCPVCGTSLDRDENAARNILALGLQSLGIQSVEAPPFMAGE